MPKQEYIKFTEHGKHGGVIELANNSLPFRDLVGIITTEEEAFIVKDARLRMILERHSISSTDPRYSQIMKEWRSLRELCFRTGRYAQWVTCPQLDRLYRSLMGKDYEPPIGIKPSRAAFS